MRPRTTDKQECPLTPGQKSPVFFSMKIYATARGTQVADTNMKYTLNNDTELKKRSTNV